jgi:type II secretory pathway pseudopilin PulG
MRRGSQGYTLVELLIAATIAATAMFASLNMATYALRGNTELRDSGVALGLAQHLLATIQAEGSMWVTDHPADSQTPLYLRQLPAPPTVGQGTGWLVARVNPYDTDKRVGDLGDDSVVFDVGVQQELPSGQRPRFCVHYRMFWVGTGLARAEVRVSWARPHVGADTFKACPIAMIDDVASASGVALTGTVMRNGSVQ